MNFPAEISFIVSQNDKGDNPKRPDYRGEVKLAGLVYEVAAWRKKKQGTERQFISGTLKLKQQPASERPAEPTDEGFTPNSSQPSHDHPDGFDPNQPFG